MAIAVGTVVQGTDTLLDSVPFTTTVDVGSGTDRALLVAIWVNGGGPMDSVTFNSVALTADTALTFATNIRLQFWYLSNPASGSHTLSTVRVGLGNGSIYVAAIPLTGCHQTTASLIRATQVRTATTAGFPVSDDITSATDDLVFDLVGGLAVGGPTLTAGAGQTERAKQTSVNGGTGEAGVSSEPGAATVTMSWTAVNADTSTGHVVVSVVPSAVVDTGPIKSLPTLGPGTYAPPMAGGGLYS